MITGDDKNAIDEKSKVLMEASSKLAERVYAKKAQADGAAAKANETAQQGPAANGEKVVDAEFTEVNDNDKK